jgi:hypothetical protein
MKTRKEQSNTTHRILAQYAAEDPVGGVGGSCPDHVCGVDVLELAGEANLLEVLLGLQRPGVESVAWSQKSSTFSFITAVSCFEPSGYFSGY